MQDIRFISETEHGVHEDQPGVHPSVLEEFYGAEDNLEGDWSDIDELIADDQARDVRHAAVEVPEHYSPFDAETEAIFFQTLEELEANEYIPDGYGLTPESWAMKVIPPASRFISAGEGKKFL